MSKSLKKIKINKVVLNNRVIVGPMCQYSSSNGSPSKWHYGHLQSLAQSNAGMVMMESTAVSAKGRITKKDLTLINKKNEKDLKELVSYIKSFCNVPIGIQLSHSGRKGSAKIPWIKSNTSLNKKEGKWETFAPSSIKRDKNWPLPKEMSQKDINLVVKQFKDSAKRANRSGFDCLEIHMAHGYLLHQFFSPISNKRQDLYGGNLENRCRFLIKICTEVRKIWPKNKILSARVTGDDCLPDGIKINDCIYLVKALKKIGIDMVCVTSGGILPKTNIVFKTAYQAHLAKKVKLKTKVLTRTSGLITNLSQVNRLIDNNYADFVSIARKFINEPTWLINDIKKTKNKMNISNPYLRCF